ncbi:DNA primase [Chloroflexota bacterium]
MSAIDEVKQKTDIVEVIGQYATLKKAGRNLTALCPFHSENHPSFFVYPEQQSWHCFGACNTGGDAFSFIMKKEGIDFGEALRLLAERAGITLPSRREPDSRKEEKEELYRINDAATLHFHNLLLNSPAAEKARGYVAGRGFSAQTVTDFQLGFSLDSWEALKQHLRERSHSEENIRNAGLLAEADNGKTYDRFRGKLMFPIRDIKGRTIGFGARVLDDSLPKYVNSPQTPTFDKSSILYGLDLAAAAIRKQEMAVIMEGYMDVITAHQNGITNVVASMGTAITETQVNILKKLSRNLVLALDADAAGEEAMLRGVGYENTLNAEIRVIILPEGKDPDDVIREDATTWQDLVAKAVPIVDYTFDKVTSQLDLNTARGKSLTVERLLPVAAEIKDPVRQAHYMQKLARLAGVTERTLEAALARAKPAAARRRTPEVKPREASHIRHFLAANPREEYCLAFLLHYSELKNRQADLAPEYFENSENREIFTAWQQADDPASLREKLDSAMQEHLDKITQNSLIDKNLTPADAERRFTDCIMELKKQYYRNFEAKRAEILAHEAELGGAGADLARLEAEGMEPSTRLKEVFAHKKRNGHR